MGYEVEVAIVAGHYPRHVETAWLQQQADGRRVVHMTEKSQQPRNLVEITIQDYGVWILVMDLCEIGPGPLHRLLNEKREENWQRFVYPRVRGPRVPEIEIDYYGDPLTALSARDVLEALNKTMTEDLHPRLSTFKSILDAMLLDSPYGDLTVVAWGH